MKRQHGLSLACLGLLVCGLTACEGSEGGLPRPPEAPPTIDRPKSPTKAVEVVAGIDPTVLVAAERKRPLVAVTSCNLERLNGQPFTAVPGEVSAGADQFRLSGWVADIQRGTVPQTAEIRLDNVAAAKIWRVRTDVTVKREDVQALLGGTPEFERPGFSAVINTGELESGTYRAYLVFADGNELKVCDNGRRVTVP